MGSQACCSSQGKLQIQDIHELDVEAAAQVVSRKDTGCFAWLQSLALQLYAFCQFCRLHFHHLQKYDTSHLECTEQHWQPKRVGMGLGGCGGAESMHVVWIGCTCVTDIPEPPNQAAAGLQHYDAAMRITVANLLCSSMSAGGNFSPNSRCSGSQAV